MAFFFPYFFLQYKFPHIMTHSIVKRHLQVKFFLLIKKNKYKLYQRPHCIYLNSITISKSRLGEKERWKKNSFFLFEQAPVAWNAKKRVWKFLDNILEFLSVCFFYYYYCYYVFDPSHQVNEQIWNEIEAQWRRGYDEIWTENW